MMPDRCDEIRRLNQMTPDEVIARAGKHLVVYEDLEALHRGFAEDMAQELRARNAAGERTRWIVPVGPVGQYPYFAQIVNRERLSMDNACLLFMDEYVDEYGEVLGWDDPLSFRTLATRWLLNKLDPELMPPPGNIVFPNGDNIDQIAGAIKKAGGVDTCFGGIGIHGHVAFNEPEPGVAKLGPRKVRLNDFTVTINAVRAQVGGNLECFPREAYTLGMAQILGARRIRLYCRNGCPFDWANTILRVALFGKPGDDYPVTHIRGRDYVIATDRETLSSPRHLI
jgi:glucosamine-6-phosphate deaminase